jgi:DNA-binding MarR family transcriptional regulator
MQPSDVFTATLREWVALFMRRSMRNFMQYVRESGLSMSQVGALFHIRRERGCGVTDLGENLGITSAAASQLLERLVQQELVVRAEDPEDRRVKRLFLTDKGLQTIQESINARQVWLDELTETLSVNELEQVNAALKLLIEKAKSLDNFVVLESYELF